MSPLSSPHFPIRSLNLRHDEFAFVVKGKLRPAIVIGGGNVRWPTNPTEQLYLCVPLYTVDKPKIPQKFVVDTQAFLLPGMFYMPESSAYGIKESLARFGLMQVAHIYAIRQSETVKDPVMLSAEFFALLKTHLTTFLGGTQPPQFVEDLRAYGDIVLDEAKRLGVE